AFSDVYAMGATPLVALNLVGWPREELPFELLGEVLRGGAEVARAAGAFVLGGHSVDDPEPKYGMVAIGEVHPDRIVPNGGVTAAAVRLLPRAREAAERGAIPGGLERNAAAVADAVAFADGVDRTTRLLRADAQTSGGLLIAVAPERADALVAALGREGTLAAAVIGRVVAGGAGRIAVR